MKSQRLYHILVQLYHMSSDYTIWTAVIPYGQRLYDKKVGIIVYYTTRCVILVALIKLLYANDLKQRGAKLLLYKVHTKKLLISQKFKIEDYKTQSFCNIEYKQNQIWKAKGKKSLKVCFSSTHYLIVLIIFFQIPLKFITGSKPWYVAFWTKYLEKNLLELRVTFFMIENLT